MRIIAWILAFLCLTFLSQKGILTSRGAKILLVLCLLYLVGSLHGSITWRGKRYQVRGPFASKK